MKKESLSDALNLLNDDIIEQADATRKINKRYKIMRITRACVAACLVIAIGIGSIILLPKFKFQTSDPQTNTPENTNLPMLTISEGYTAAGFEGYMVHDISELVNANPWTEDCKINTLPVYNNPAFDLQEVNATEIHEKFDFDSMRDFLYDIGKRLNLTEDQITVTQYDSYYEKKRVEGEADGIKLAVGYEMTATIHFEPSLSLPDEYKFTHHNSSYEDMLAVAEYLKSEYSSLINFKNPQINITRGDYDIYNRQSYGIEFFDGSGDLVRDIINYNFNQVTFACNDDGNLWIISVNKPDLSEKIGDYPIITADEAKQLLAKGNFTTSVPFDFPGAEYARKVELVYQSTYWMSNIYMPYYRFYVELPELENRFGHGLKNYGAYYVPAVEGKYISNMPVWDRSFN